MILLSSKPFEIRREKGAIPCSSTALPFDVWRRTDGKRSKKKLVVFSSFIALLFCCGCVFVEKGWEKWHILEYSILFYFYLILGTSPRTVNMYVKLLYVQSDLGNETQQRLIKKFTSFIQSFKSTDKKTYDEWLNMKSFAFKSMSTKDILARLGFLLEN